MPVYVIGYYDPKRGAWPLVRVEDAGEIVIAYGPMDEIQMMANELNDLTSDKV